MPIRIPPLGWVAVPSPNNRISPIALANAVGADVDENARGMDFDDSVSRRASPASARIDVATAGAAGPLEVRSTNPEPGPVAGRAGTFAATAETGRATRSPAASGTDDSGPTELPRRGMPVPPPRRSEPRTLLAATGTAPTAPASPAPAERAPVDRADRGPTFDLSAPAAGADGPEVELDPDSAPGPAGSADATPCREAIAAPTPTATATAPTRPRYSEYLLRGSPTALTPATGPNRHDAENLGSGRSQGTNSSARPPYGCLHTAHGRNNRNARSPGLLSPECTKAASIVEGYRSSGIALTARPGPRGPARSGLRSA